MTYLATLAGLLGFAALGLAIYKLCTRGIKPDHALEQPKPKPKPKRTLYGTEPIKCLQAPKMNIDRNYPNYKKKWKPSNNLVTLHPNTVIKLNSVKGGLMAERDKILTKGYDGFKIGGKK